MPIERAILGEGVVILHRKLVNLYGCTVGPRTKIGAFVEIGDGVSIGADCKIQTGAFIPPGVVIGREVFIGPNVTFTNVKHPMREQFVWYTAVKTIVHDGAVIGANATILPGLVIGKDAVVGAGAVVTRDVPAGATVVGNPAR